VPDAGIDRDTRRVDAPNELDLAALRPTIAPARSYASGSPMTDAHPQDTAAHLLRTIPLFAALDARAVDDLLHMFKAVNFAAGTKFVRQGHAADGAYVLASGHAEALTALPGGGETAVAQLGPGSVIGEMALLDRAVRSATVVARDAVCGWFVERDAFRVLLARQDRAAATLHSRITRTLAQRLRELNARIVATGPDASARPLSTRAAPSPPSRRQCSFDFRAFLPLLPACSGFDAEDIDDLVSRTQVIEIDRGQVLFEQGAPGVSACLVVRGAIEIDHATAKQRQRIGILGPGRLCGILALIEGHAHSLTATARENSVVLEIGQPSFDALFLGVSRTATKFRNAIDRELLQALARTNNHLTRLISQARIRGGRRDTTRANALQCALASTEYRAA